MIKQLKEEIRQEESSLQKLMNEMNSIWEDTGLDPKDPSYLIEKTMRFELAQKNIEKIFLIFKDLLDKYKTLCSELEKPPEE